MTGDGNGSKLGICMMWRCPSSVTQASDPINSQVLSKCSPMIGYYYISKLFKYYNENFKLIRCQFDCEKSVFIDL